MKDFFAEEIEGNVATLSPTEDFYSKEIAGRTITPKVSKPPKPSLFKKKPHEESAGLQKLRLANIPNLLAQEPGIALVRKAFSPEAMKRGADISGITDIPAVMQDIASIPQARGIPEIRQAPPSTIGEKIKGFFRESPQVGIAKAQNIYAISQAAGIPLPEVRKNYQELARQEKITGIRPGIGKKEYMELATAPLMAAGLAVNPVGTLAGLTAFGVLDKLIPTEKFIPSDINDDVRTAIELADFIGKGAIVGGVFRKAPAALEKFTKTKLTEYNLPKTVRLSSKQVKDIYQTGKLTTPEQQSLYGSLGLKSHQLRDALQKGIDINIPAEKIVRLTDKPFWGKIKSAFGIKPFEKITAASAEKPRPATAGLLPQLKPATSTIPLPSAAIAQPPIAPIPVVSFTPAVITDKARIQTIRNSIAEGEMILKSGKNISGKKMDSNELDMVRKSVENAKAKIGELPTPPPAAKSPLIIKAEQAPVKTAAAKVIPAKKTLQVLPRKEQLLVQIQEAIEKAPTLDEEYTKYKQKLNLKGYTQEETTQIHNAIPRITFQTDGGANIINAKESLQKFYDAIWKTSATTSSMVLPEKITATAKPTAGKQEKIDALINLPTKEYFTDGKVLIKGTSPKSAKFGGKKAETKEVTALLESKTEPAQFLYYATKSPGAHGVSAKPLPQVDKDYVPKAVFQSGNKYYVYDQFRFNAIKNRYPEVTYGITKIGHLIAYYKSEPVALLLPMQPPTIESGQQFTEIPPLAGQAQRAGIYKPLGAKDFYKEEMETSGTFAKEPSRPREIDVTHIAKTPEEWKKTIEQLNKFGQMQSILRRTGGISKKQAVGQFVRPGKGKLTKRVLPTGEVRLRSEYIEPPFNYASVLAHELGHALEWNLLKSINKVTFKVFGDDLTPDIIAKIKDELIAVTKALEGEAVVSGNPRYYLQKTELLARFMQKMIESPGNLGEIAPTAWDNFQKQAIKHPIIGEFLEAMRETIDKGQTKFYILPDLREMHLSQLGKRAGELAYGDVLAYQALKERAKTILERFLNTKFKGVKDSPELLFNAAESIKVTKSGKPEFGTRDFQIAKNEQEELNLRKLGWELTGERIEDGIKYSLYAKARYTPEEAEDFFTQLSPEGQALIKEFTAQKDEAKDLFNREVLKATYKIEGDIEGWVHHYIEGRPVAIPGGKRIKEAKAGTRFHREGSEDFVKDLQKSLYKAMVDLEGEKAYNDFIQRWFPRVTKPILEGQSPEPGWVEVVGDIRKGVGTTQEKKTIIIDKATGKTFVARQVRYQMPKAIYERYKLIKDLQDEATTMMRVVNDLNRYWRVNILFYLGSTGTNFISGGIQYTHKIVSDFYTELLTGQLELKQTRRDVSAIVKALMPRGWFEAEDWMYGGDVSSFYGQFTEKPGLSKAVDAYADKTLKLYGAVERYWKKVILLSENVSTLDRLKQVTKEGLAIPTNEERQLLVELNNAVDLYAYNYNNVPGQLEEFNRHPLGSAIKPFLKYPYKYAKQVLNIIGSIFDRTLSWRERLAALLSITTLVSVYAMLRNKQKEKQLTPEGTEETPAYVSPRGRLFIGADKEGLEMFVRTAKYPFFNLSEAGMQFAEGHWEAGKDQLSDMLGSLGPVGQMGILALDYRNKYQLYTPVPVILGDSIATFMPGYRILNDISRMQDPFQRKQEYFYQSFTKVIPTTDSDLQDKLHGKIRTIRVPVEGAVTGAVGRRTTIDKPVLNYKDDILLSLLSGIYIKRIDPDEAQAFIIRKEKNERKKLNQ